MVKSNDAPAKQATAVTKPPTDQEINREIIKNNKEILEINREIIDFTNNFLAGK
jgi:hypothetical protein